jgi:TMEM175 potassium channel family protein
LRYWHRGSNARRPTTIADVPRIGGGWHDLTVTADESRSRAPVYRTGRMEAFSDGVFAIAITLLVLEIGVPAGTEDDLLKALGDQWPSYLAYFVSFSTIGAVWFAHTVITEYLDHADSVLLRLNLLLLLVVSFLPFPTRLLAEYASEPEPERIAATVYGINLLLTMIMVSVTWRYAAHAKLVRPDLADEDVKTLTKRLTPTLGVYVVMIGAGLFLPILAVFGYLAIAVFILVPFSALRHRPNHT